MSAHTESVAPHRRRAALVFVLLAAASQVECTSGSSPTDAGPPRGKLYNPVADVFDPTIVTHGGQYYLIGTSGDNRLRLFRSSTIAGLRTAEPIIIWEGPAAGLGCCRLWSPVLERVRGRWYVYLSVTDSWGNASSAALYALEGDADDPAGPYQLKPAVKSWKAGDPGPWERGIVGPAVIEMPDGRLYLTSTTFGFYLQEMDTPWSLKPGTSMLSIDDGAPTLSWEGGTSEIARPIVRLVDGKPRVFVPYSSENHVENRTLGGPCWSFCVGMFVNDSGELTSREAWHKAPDPVFAGGPELGLYRVLALATFSSPDGKEDWMVYNASDAPSTSFGDRDTFVQPFSFRADGTPDFGRPTPLAEALSVPSGETGSLSALSPGSELLASRFDDADSASSSWSALRGSWTIAHGQYVAAAAEDAIASAGELRWVDYTVQASVVAENDPVDAGLDVLARVGGSEDFYFLELMRDGSGARKWAIAAKRAGSYATLASGPYDWRPGVRYWLRLDLNTERLTGLISTDGKTFQLLGSARDGARTFGQVGLRTWGGLGARFDEVTVTQGRTSFGIYTGPGWPGLVIDAGGSPAKEFCDELYQEYCVGGRQLATMSAIDLSGVKDPLPLAMYQTERWNYPANGLDAAFHYIVPSLEPGRRYRVRLHFAELHYTQAGQRTFRVSVNEKLVLDEFDKVAAAGGPLRATVHEVLAEATPRGQIVLRFHPGTRPGADHNPTVSAIEVLPAL